MTYRTYYITWHRSTVTVCSSAGKKWSSNGVTGKTEIVYDCESHPVTIFKKTSTDRRKYDFTKNLKINHW